MLTEASCGESNPVSAIAVNGLTLSSAIALVEVDQALTPPILDTVRALPNVIQVKALRF